MNRRDWIYAVLASPLFASAPDRAGAAARPGASLLAKFYTTPLLAPGNQELPEEGVFRYSARRGDTFASLAAKFYADPAQGKMIARWNGLAASSRLRSNQELQLLIPRLGLLVAIEVMAKSEQGCDLETVSENRTFGSDDLFRLRVSPNSNGWLYAFNRQPDSSWRRLHPAEVAAGELLRFRDYALPDQSTETDWFRLDHEDRAEELVLLFASDAIDELDDIMSIAVGSELPEKQENLLESLLDREEKAEKGITRVEGDRAKREAGAIIALGPESGTPILIHRLKLRRAASEKLR